VNIACVIGNGPSRKHVDLETIGRQMTTYGCNVLYRDYMPDYLISMDWAIVEEILANDIHHKTNFYTQDTSQFNFMSVEKKERINWLKNMARRLDSGNSALEVALEHEYETIYVIGFDYNTDDKLPNVYHGTKNYARNSTVPAAESMAREWQSRLRKLVKEFPDTQIIRVNGSNTSISIEATNYSEITTEQFKEIYESRN
jgi:uncharacterized protein Veg